MRLFIAVSFPAPLREQLRQAAGRLQGSVVDNDSGNDIKYGIEIQRLF